MDRGFSSLPTRCSLTDLHLHLLKQKQRVRNGSGLRSRQQVPRNSLDLNTTKSRDFAQSHAHSESPMVFSLSAKVLPGTLYSSSKYTTTRHMSSQRVSFGLGCPLPLSSQMARPKRRSSNNMMLVIVYSTVLAWRCFSYYLFFFFFFFAFESPPATSTYKSFRQLTVLLSSISLTTGGS